MKVLAINTGSSSVKFQVVDTKLKRSLIKGIVDAIGLSNSRINFELSDGKRFSEVNIETEVKNHKEAIKYAIDIILDSGISKKDIQLVVHRVVHGGKYYSEPVIITRKVINKIRELSELAPLHNPHNLKGIEEAKKYFPKVKHVALFDTAFHQTMPERAFLYGLPWEFYTKKKIRRYGFHGTSHHYVSKEAVKIMKKTEGKKDFKLITCHIGNGISVAAVQVKKGKPISLDTSMGFTPLEGSIMGTRSGTLDPGIIIYLLDKGYDKKEINNILNKKSGLLGLSGKSSDMRILLKNYETDRRSKLVIDLLTYQLAKIIASYTVPLGGLDAIVFTAGIGEGSWFIRKKICEQLKHFGVELNPRANRKNEEIISSKKSRVKVMVIKTQEELEMAIEAEELLKKKNKFIHH